MSVVKSKSKESLCPVRFSYKDTASPVKETKLGHIHLAGGIWMTK